MRFRAPRSASSSPERETGPYPRKFGVPSDSDTEDYNSELESESSLSSSPGSSRSDLVDDVKNLSLVPSRIARDSMEGRRLEEDVEAIRVYGQYRDPFEDWEQLTRSVAFKTAIKQFSEKHRQILEGRTKKFDSERVLRDAQHNQESAKLRHELDGWQKKLNSTNDNLMKTFTKRDQDLWDRIEKAIKLDETKVAKRLEEERKIKEEEEQKRKEAEVKKRLAEEKIRFEESEKKKKEQEEALKKKQSEEEVNRKKNAELELRSILQTLTDDDDWRIARTNLHNLKTTIKPLVQNDPSLKVEWAKIRRQIVPKVGQLTDDPRVISQITQQLFNILKPNNAPPLPAPLYVCGCYSLAKAFIRQAETEVSATKVTAGPLSQVAFSLLETLEDFPDIFFAKIVQRCGGWPIPFFIPNHDWDGAPWASNVEYTYVAGWRKSATSEHTESLEESLYRRVAIMRVYFGILKIRPNVKPLDPMFRLPRCWTWFARITGNTKLLGDPMAAELIYTALDIVGLTAKDVWGRQWVKMLALIHEGVTIGYDKGKLIGGDSPLAAAARMRIILALENILNGVQS